LADPHSHQNHFGKRVRAVLDIGVNYLFHVLASARVGFDSDYADMYANSIRPEDIAYLKKHKRELTFGAGEGGELVDVFLLPAAFSLQSKDDFGQYYRLLLEGCDRDDFTKFLEFYTDPILKLKQWAGHPDNDAMRGFVTFRDTIERLAEISLENYDSYANDVWPKEKPGLKRVAAAVNEVFENHDRVGRWEEVTGLTFKFDIYQILLCSAIKNGPDADSLGYDRVVFHHRRPFGNMVEFISHEIGTHIFMDDIKLIRDSSTYRWPELYEGFECLARYYNTLVLEKTDLKYTLPDYHVDEYMNIYRELHRKQPDISVREMLEQGVAKFLATRVKKS